MNRGEFPSRRWHDSSCMLGRRPACMAQYLSEDLRIRVIRAVEGGMSRHAAARRFGVSVASAVRWMAEYLRTGRTAPKPRGGNRRSGRIEAQADLLLRHRADAGHHAGRATRAADRRAGRDFRRQHDPRFLPAPRDHRQPKKVGACQRAGARGRSRATRGLVRGAARARSHETGVYRRDRDHQDGAAARAQPPRRTLPRRRAPRPLEDHHAGRGPAPRQA